MSTQIRQEIVQRRKERIKNQGHDFGHAVPLKREQKLVPFVSHPLLICEIKRRSPSRGQLSADLDPLVQAQRYHALGVNSISILTEEDYFSGSLEDLMLVKRSLPDVAVLRKDFLLDIEDIEVSFRAGADAILLIASMLEKELLYKMYYHAVKLGMAVLVEVHDHDEIALVAELKPILTGINCRDLQNFRLDRLLPLARRQSIDWPCDVVFESGIFTEEDAYFAASNGFSGILVGESVVKNAEIIPSLKTGLVRGMDQALSNPQQTQGFWQRIANTIEQKADKQPLVKICGLCREEDARLAAELGADVLGFIFADSPRRCDPALLEKLADLSVLKVAVVVVDSAMPGMQSLPKELLDLLERGLVDALQLSGHESPSWCASLPWPYYKVARLKQLSDIDALDTWRSPRILVDAWDQHVYGGSGKRLSHELVTGLASKHSLWLAGGLNADNVRQVIEDYHPELLDLASGIEAKPGVKDHQQMRRFFSGVNT